MIPGCHEVASLNEGRVKWSGSPSERPDPSLRFPGIVFRQQQVKARNTHELVIGVGLGYEVNAGAVTADRLYDEPVLVIFEANKLSYLWCWQHLSLLRTQTRIHFAHEHATNLLEDNRPNGTLSDTTPIDTISSSSQTLHLDHSSSRERCFSQSSPTGKSKSSITHCSLAFSL